MEINKIAPNFTVQDIEKSVAFYRDMLGFKLETAWYGMREFYVKDCNGYIRICKKKMKMVEAKLCGCFATLPFG